MEAFAIRRYGSGMRPWITALALALGSVALGCGDKSAVSLSVSVANASVSADTGTLGSTLGGGFQLDFELGPEASGATTVTLGDFSLQSASGTAIVDPLQVDAGSTSFPLKIDKGGSQNVSFTITSKALLTQAQHDAICGGQVVIVGSGMDSLKGGTDSLRSVAITPTCS